MTTNPPSRRSPASALLGVSALVLAALVVLQWSRLPGGTPTLAEMVAGGPAGDVAVMTSDGGSDDIVIVLDQRAEELLVYQPQNGRALTFRGRYPLRDLFAEGRILGGTAPLPTTTPQPAINPSR